MTAVNQARYRSADFIGGRILEARELNLLQTIQQGVGLTGVTTSYEQTAIYRQGALLNATVTITGATVSITATNLSNPVLVFVRDRWELVLTGEFPAITLTGVQNTIYLNWQLVLVDNTQDPTLVDGATGQPTAKMGQLVLEAANFDDSARATAATELAKNTNTIILVQLSLSGGVYSLVPIDNVKSQAYGSNTTSGLVSLTTGTATGVAVSTDDPRMTNARTPSTGSVQDSSVRTPVAVSPAANNADGTSKYDLTVDAGGINAAKIILQNTTQRLSDAWTWFLAAFNTLLARYNAHEGIVLGLSNTHPFPTPAQVGATPLSHVGQPLNLVTSHPATVNQSSGGFVLNRVVDATGTYSSTPMDPAYSVYEGTSLRASLNHDGDLYSHKADQITVAPGGGPINYTGILGLFSNLAQVVADHVNQISHANPHGLTLLDLGGVNVTQAANLQGFKSFGTVYTNPGPGALFVGVTAKVGAGGALMHAYVDTVTPPGVMVAGQDRIAAADSDIQYNVYISFFVPSGYHYMVDNPSGGDTGPFTLVAWTEWSFV